MITGLQLKQTIGICTSDRTVANSIMDEIIAEANETGFTKHSSANSLSLNLGGLISVKWIQPKESSRGVRLTKVIVDDAINDKFIQEVILPMCGEKNNIIKINAEDFKDDGLPF